MEALTTILKLSTGIVAPVVREECGAWDSLRHMELIFAIEEEFELEFSSEEIAAIDGTDKLIALIEANREA